jgi:hypothetical protein
MQNISKVKSGWRDKKKAKAFENKIFKKKNNEI